MIQTIELDNGYVATIQQHRDDGMCEPWKASDGHGVVSEWEHRDKLPGERILCEDRGARRFYDVQESIKIAKRDGWDAPPYTGTKGEKAARAVDADFEYLRAWCDDRWCWVIVEVTVYLNDDEVDTDYLGGVESCGNYWLEEGERMARDLADKHYKARKSQWRAKLHEAREARAWAYRDVATV